MIITMIWRMMNNALLVIRDHVFTSFMPFRDAGELKASVSLKTSITGLRVFSLTGMIGTRT